jgi:hypothetical protein
VDERKSDLAERVLDTDEAFVGVEHVLAESTSTSSAVPPTPSGPTRT